MGRKRILVIDDETAILDMLKDMFEFMEVEADFADTASKGIELIRKGPDLYKRVLLDLELPDMDGSEAFDKLIELAPHLEVFIFSGHGEGEKSDKIIEKGAIGLISKPFRIEEMKKFVEER